MRSRKKPSTSAPLHRLTAPVRSSGHSLKVITALFLLGGGLIIFALILLRSDDSASSNTEVALVTQHNQVDDTGAVVELVVPPRGLPRAFPQYTLNGYKTKDLFDSSRGDWWDVNPYCSMNTKCRPKPMNFKLYKGELGCEDVADFIGKYDWCKMLWDDKDGAKAEKDGSEARKVCLDALINSGYWRDVYLYTLADGRRAVLKVLKSKHTGSVRNLLRSLRESILLQYVKDSEDILGEYGHCFNARTNDFLTITPFMENGNLEELITLKEYKESTDLRRVLLWCWNIAKALEKMHNYPGGPFVHADLQPRQFLVAEDGSVLMNDFNRGKFIPFNGDEKCKYCGARSKGRYRAPEEYTREPLDESLDIYSTAMVYFSLFIGDKVMQDIPKTEVYKKIPNGFRPEFPHEMPPALQELVIQMWHPTPEKRPTATKVVLDIEKIIDTEEASLDTLLKDLKYDVIDPMPWGELHKD